MQSGRALTRPARAFIAKYGCSSLVCAHRPRTPRAGDHRKPETQGGCKSERNEGTKSGNSSLARAEGQKKETATAKGKVRRTKTRSGGRPARPSQEEQAHAHTHETREVSASTQDSPRAPAEAPVQRRTVQERRRGHNCQTTAVHPAGDGSQRDPPGTTPGQGPKRAQRQASVAAPLRWAPAATTMSTAPGRRPRVPGSLGVNPRVKAPGRGRHHGNGKAIRDTESNRTA